MGSGAAGGEEGGATSWLGHEPLAMWASATGSSCWCCPPPAPAASEAAEGGAAGGAPPSSSSAARGTCQRRGGCSSCARGGVWERGATAARPSLPPRPPLTRTSQRESTRPPRQNSSVAASARMSSPIRQEYAMGAAVEPGGA